MTTLDLDRAALHQTILDAPEDDLPRLIYADHLEEFGDEVDRLRAEFIRVQVELAAIGHLHPPADDDDRATIRRAKALRQREADLLIENRDATGWSSHARWAPKILRSLPSCAWHFRRGFVEALTLTAADWLAHADALTAAAPVREVRLTSLPVWDESRPTGRESGPPKYRLVGAKKWLRSDQVPFYSIMSVRANIVIACLHAEWPRIKFTLPE